MPSLLKGGDATGLCRKHGTSCSRLYSCPDRFVDAHTEHLKRPGDGKDSREGRVSCLQRNARQLVLQFEIPQEVARQRKRESVALRKRFVDRGYPRKTVAGALGLHRSAAYRLGDRNPGSVIKYPATGQQELKG